MTVAQLPPRRWAPAPSEPGQDVLRASELGALLLIGASVVASWPMLLAAAHRPVSPLGLLAHVAGMLAGYGMVVLLLLMARSPLLERGVGADVLARWHARIARAVVVLIALHAWAATLAWAQTKNEGIAIASWQVFRLPALAATTLGTLLIFGVAAMSVRAARRRLSHERWHSMHLLMYVAAALTFAHQLVGPDFAGHVVLQVLWALAYTNVFALVVHHRVLVPLRQATRHRLRVVEVRQEGAGVVSILVEGHRLDELRAEAGQFFRWRFLTPDHWRTAHPFSLSAEPTDRMLRLTVKELGDGSRRLQELLPGTWVVAEGPYGAVTAGRRTTANVALIAGGVGITPMRALFATLPLEYGDDLLLIYRARSEADLIFRSELDRIAKERGARILYVLGEDQDALAPARLLAIAPDLARRDIYMCGPPGLTSAVRRVLGHLGHPRDLLHEERFDL